MCGIAIGKLKPPAEGSNHGSIHGSSQVPSSENKHVSTLGEGVPVIVTLVPPAAGPELGLTENEVGAA